MLEMVNACFASLFHLLTVNTFGLMLIGIAIGFAVGILPGLGGPVTIALMLPFIVKMNPTDAFAFILGMAAVTNTTGDITSILLGIPGETSTLVTMFDGHPMAKKGEAGRALGAALMSSLIGALFGACVLALAIPVVRPLVLAFGSPEFFMLAFLGITFVAALSGGDLLKALIAGGLGLFLATVGLDPMTGTQRYAFDQTFLWDGVGVVPVALGLFAIPEVIDLAVQGTSIARIEAGNLGGVMQGVKDTFLHLWLVIRCSAMAAFMSIVPGMGAASQFLVYAHVVQSSPVKERFGKGAVEGVLGPGAANNATLGGSLVTTLAFGVPTGLAMAMILAAFVIQGIVPGPKMLIPEPKGNLTLTFSFVWINVLANLITVGLCFLILKQLVKITRIRGALLIPFVILLIFLGAFAEKNEPADLILVLFFGFVGWGLGKLHWPLAPLILGLVLGPLAENRLFLSIQAYGLRWLSRPAVLVIFALMLAGVFYSIFRTKRRKAEKVNEQRSAAETSRLEAIGSNLLRYEMLFAVFIVVLIGIALRAGIDFKLRAGLFPWVSGSMTLILSIIFLVNRVKQRWQRSAATTPVSKEPDPGRHHASRRTAGIFGWIIGYFTAIWVLGFAIAAPLCTLLQLRFGAREKWSLTLALSAGAWLVFYGFFQHVVNVPFPMGRLFLWLGLG